jgi:hypothetical protein
VLRALVAAAAVVAVTGAVFMRSWDRSAGRRVADLTRGRENDQWQTEERVAELEADIDESRELRVKLETRLRAKRVELAALRGEHAALLRRYATAETERAGALEGRRQLALRAAAEPKALPPAGSTPTATAYLRAEAALDDLTHNAAAQQVRRTIETARERDLAERVAEAKASERPTAGEQHSRPSSALPATRTTAASAIVPYSPASNPVRQAGAGFDFFGTQGLGPGSHPQADTDDPGPAAHAGVTSSAAAAAAGAPDRAADAVEAEDLADVVGEETLAAQRRTEQRAVGKVIDLTEHDETEPLDIGHLRSAIGS